MGNLWKHDMRQGFEMNRAGCVLLFVVLLASFAMFGLEMRTLLSWVEIEERFTLGDALWYLHKGTNFVPSSTSANIYKLPVVWIFQMVLLHYLVGYYPVRDWQSSGIQVLLRTGSRRRWWAAKVLWVLTVNLLFTLLQTAVLTALTLLMGGRLSLSLTEIAFSLGAGNLAALEPMSLFQEIRLLILMPLLVQTALTLLQLFLMFLVGPFWAFIGLMAYEMAATCLPSGWLLANYTMCRRVGEIVPFCDEAKEAAAGTVGSVLLAAGMIAAGFFLIRKKDILPKEGNEE